LACPKTSPASMITRAARIHSRFRKRCHGRFFSSEATFNFVGKKALVSGGAGEIGREIVAAMAGAGAEVMAVDLQEEKLESLKAYVDEKGTGAVRTLACDISDEDQIAKMESWAEGATLAVHCAAIAPTSPLLDLEMEEFDRVSTINSRGSALFLRSAARLLRDAKANKADSNEGGSDTSSSCYSIVAISSQASQRGLRNHFSYCSSKASLDQMVRVMALELGPLGIRTNAVNPTVVRTDLGKAIWHGEMAENMLDRIPMGRFAEPSDVVWPVMFLLSDGASMINGATIPIDGGYWASPVGGNVL